jgi:hypothetical protein
MQRLLFGLLFGVLISARASAQELVIPEVAYPALPKRGLSAQDFVPKGWKLETQTAGDLDKDGKNDLLLLLRMDDAKNVIKNERLGRDPFDTNPRILAVAFGSGMGKPYRLMLENHTLIARSSDPVLDDVLAETGGIAIERGTLNIALHLFSSAGSWTMGTTTYSFRHGKNGFELIGFDRSTIDRGDGSLQDISINYLTHKVKIGTGTIEDDEVKVEWRTLPKKPLLKIEEIGDGLEFEPLS